MKIAVVSDELYPVHSFVLEWLKGQGHEPVLFGALKSEREESWVQSAWEAAQAIKEGICDEGIFFCWTGTGISIAANKLPGIRAALCGDAETARGARIWNHANVLALSNRLLDQEVAKEILAAWFEDFDVEKGAKGVTELKDFEGSLSMGTGIKPTDNRKL
jgi:ribose 5-phosphate isomerase B